MEEQTYKDGNYQESLKRAFLGTDEDILKSDVPEPSSLPLANRHIVGPDFVRDPSGCTAVVALITEDDRIFVVRKTGFYPCFVAVTDFPLSDTLVAFLCWAGLGYIDRPMPVIRDASSVPRVNRSH